jgi:hypothetical protein
MDATVSNVLTLNRLKFLLRAISERNGRANECRARPLS